MATTVTAELATALAMTGRSVAVIEADLRAPELLRAWRIDGDAPAAASGWPSEAVTVTGLDRLTVYPGQVVDNPLEVLGSDRVQTLLKDVRAEVDFVLVLVPPLLSAVDGLAVHLVDGVVLVEPTRPAADDLPLVAEAVGHTGGVLLGTIVVGSRGSTNGRFA